MFDGTNDAAIGGVVETLRRGVLLRYDDPDGLGSPVSDLENDLAATMGTSRAVAVNSGGSGVQLALEACGLRPGDEVLIPAFTFVAVPSAIVLAGGRPRLVECTDDYVIDCDDLEAKLTPDTRFLVLSYARGRVPDMARVLDLCRRHSVTVIEDAAHALGARWHDRPVGTLGRVGVIAFHGVMDTGEGAVVLTDDDDVADRVLVGAGCYDRNWRHHPGVEGREASLRALTNAVPVHSMRMGNVTASLARGQLDRIEGRIEQQQADVDYVVETIRQVGGIRVPSVVPGARHVPWSIQLTLDADDTRLGHELVAASARNGVPVKIIGLDPDNSRCWWNWSFFDVDDCPRTRALLCRTIDFVLPWGLPHPSLYFLSEALVDSLRDARQAVVTPHVSAGS